ncbi:MAG: uroporphyrinogen decarboxylase family protein [Saccharofermentanales bacterium]
MNPRERIISSMNYSKTDRIPRYDIFLPDYISEWKKNKNLPDETYIYDFYNKIDIGCVLAHQEGPFYSRKGIEKRDGNSYHERDSWGRLVYKKDNAFFEKEIEAVFADKTMADKIPFESPLADERYIELSEQNDKVRKNFAPVAGVLGLYMGCYRMRGQEQFLIDLAEDKEFCKHLINRLMDFTMEAGLKVTEVTETLDTAMWVYDEFSSRLDPMFSPDIFEELFLPAYKKMIGYWKSKGMKNFILHCDGNSLPILDMIIDAGFTGIQSLAPTAGMWLPDIKRKYGDKLVLIGGMCNIVTLANGTFSDISYEAEAMAEAAKDGGVIIGTHSIDVDIPVENYDYYYSVLNQLDETW